MLNDILLTMNDNASDEEIRKSLEFLMSLEHPISKEDFEKERLQSKESPSQQQQNLF